MNFNTEVKLNLPECSAKAGNIKIAVRIIATVSLNQIPIIKPKKNIIVY